jgi:hypothetical protein
MIGLIVRGVLITAYNHVRAAAHIRRYGAALVVGDVVGLWRGYVLSAAASGGGRPSTTPNARPAGYGLSPRLEARRLLLRPPAASRWATEFRAPCFFLGVRRRLRRLSAEHLSQGTHGSSSGVIGSSKVERFGAHGVPVRCGEYVDQCVGEFHRVVSNA